MTLFLASSNPGKIAEFRALAVARSESQRASAADAQHAPAAPLGPGLNSSSASGESVAFKAALPSIELLPGFASLPPFPEDAPTFAENAAGKAMHYSRFADKCVFADDSGLVVPALGGAPGVRSARYAGESASNAERIAKLLGELHGKIRAERKAYFVCAIALAEKGRVLAVVTDRVDGVILETARGRGGFGYDSLFYFPALKKTFAELPAEEKNQHSHRGKAFLKLLRALRPA